MNVQAISSFCFPILSSPVISQAALRLYCVFKKAYSKLNSVLEEIICNTYIIAMVIFWK